MSNTTCAPVVIRWNGVPSPDMCLQAAYAGANAPVTLQAIDFSGGTPLQLWQLDIHGWLFLYGTQFCIDFVSPPRAGQPLQLVDQNESDLTQLWDLTESPTAIVNVGTSRSGMTYVMDNAAGGTSAGNQAQIWPAEKNNYNQMWSLVVLPSLCFPTGP